jgi:hypothetical protein
MENRSRPEINRWILVCKRRESKIARRSHGWRPSRSTLDESPFSDGIARL